MRRLIPLLLVPLVGCVNENLVTSLCGSDQLAFDIEEASVLQDAQSAWNMHDAVALVFDTSELPASARWRVSAVEIMPMIAAGEFDWFADGQSVGVEVWDADNPLDPPWRVDQTFTKADLEWEDAYLPDADSAYDPNQKMAWWKFEFSDLTPLEGMTGPLYLVGVTWGDSALPTVGYSNFNRACSMNWTDYADGAGWVLNPPGDSCSWPMFRVYIQLIEESAHCDNGQVIIE